MASWSAPSAAHYHESRKKFVEHRGFDCTIGADGWPTDPNHPVYRAEKLLGSAEKQPAPGKRDAPLGAERSLGVTGGIPGERLQENRFAQPNTITLRFL
jgi:hypothetical protein